MLGTPSQSLSVALACGPFKAEARGPGLCLCGATGKSGVERTPPLLREPPVMGRPTLLASGPLLLGALPPMMGVQGLGVADGAPGVPGICSWKPWHQDPASDDVEVLNELIDVFIIPRLVPAGDVIRPFGELQSKSSGTILSRSLASGMGANPAVS